MKSLLLAIALLGTLVTPGQAAAQVPCQAAINDQNVADHTGSGDAIHLNPDEPVDLALAVRGEVGTVRLRISAGPVERTLTPVGDRVPRRGTSWSGTADISDTANLGVGLYKATLTTSGGCELSAWVRIKGSPFTSVAGLTATGVLLLGLVIQVVGLIQGFRGKGGFKWALLGGIPTGLGACVLAQQFGISPITGRWVASWTTPPVAIGGIVQAGLRAMGRGSPESAGAGEPGLPHPRPAPPSPQPRAPMPQPGTDVASSSPTAPVPTGADEMPSGPRAPSPSSGGSTTRSSGRITEAAGGSGAAGVTLPGSDDEEVRDPPRESYARLECPDVVVAGEQFELTVGLTAEQQTGVSGGPLVRPPTSIGDYVVNIQVVADGFAIAPGQSWRQSLAVTADAPYPSAVVHLTAEQQDVAVKARALQAMYSVNGHTMGLAIRAVAVVRSAALAAETPAPPSPEAVGLGVPMDTTAADLTVRIQKADSESGGKLMWTFDSPHAGLPLPDAPVITDIGQEPENFVRQLITGISVQEGRPGLHAYLTGVGLTIADEMPTAFWDLLPAAAAPAISEGRQATVFLLSEEPYVPWELAVVNVPINPDPAAAQFLGAQVSMGRWILGQRRPKLPPPINVNVARMAIISGVYDQPGWSRLLDAEAEAAELRRLYSGVPVDADAVSVLRCLAGDPDADLLHFSMHGIYDPGSTTNGLVLVDGSALDPLQVKGRVLKSSPFVFLNACQVGAGSRLLGDYAGMAEAFLYAGASGVVAPLWSITDTLARDVARRFYEATFAGGAPAEVLRQERAAFREDTPSATALAYLYYGHPSLRLKRP